MVAEFELIEEIRRRFSQPSGISVGIGDDAAVFSEHFEVATTDVLVEGVHFRLDWCEPSDVGWKALTASLSDVAAMGARPGPFLATIGLGPDHGAETARGIIDGFAECTGDLGDDVEALPVGGDLSETTGPLVVSISMFGRLAGPRPLLRSEAKPGDRIVLFGTPGRSCAGLADLREANSERPESYPGLVGAYRRPTAQVRAGIAIGERELARAAIDVSDGLGRDLGHVCAASGVGARVDIGDLPEDSELEAFANSRGESADRYRIGGGEDFCLVAFVPSPRQTEFGERAEASGWPISRIGAIVSGETGVEFRGPDGEMFELAERGYEHFSGS